MSLGQQIQLRLVQTLLFIQLMAKIEGMTASTTQRLASTPRTLLTTGALAGLLLAASSAAPAALAAPDDVVPFTDQVLHECVTNQLGLAQGTAVTEAQMATLTGLNCVESGISDLQPLSFATNATTLTIRNSQLDDLSPISGLHQLTSLSLGKNEIDDITALSELRSLRYLTLEQNAITDISPLAQLTQLTDLNLGVNQITSIEPLARLTSLTSLRLDRNTITDITPVKDLTELLHLSLDTNKVSDMSIVANLVNVTHIDLDRNPVESLEGVQHLEQLRTLELSESHISDLTLLSELRNLSSLTLSSTRVTELDPLSELTNLTQLYLSNNQINDVSPLAGLINLARLDLSYNAISNAAPLRHLDQVSLLSLTFQQIPEVEVATGTRVPSPIFGFEGEPLPLTVVSGNGTAEGTDITWNTDGTGVASWSTSFDIGSTTSLFSGRAGFTAREFHVIELSGTPTAGTVGTDYRFALTLSGTPSEPTAQVTAGALPTGLTMSPAGLITGVPSTAGSFTFTVTAANGVADEVSQELTIVIHPAGSSTGGGQADNTAQLAVSGSGDPLLPLGLATIAMLGAATLLMLPRRKRS